jgi:hypothetical protein
MYQSIAEEIKRKFSDSQVLGLRSPSPKKSSRTQEILECPHVLNSQYDDPSFIIPSSSQNQENPNHHTFASFITNTLSTVGIIKEQLESMSKEKRFRNTGEI